MTYNVFGETLNFTQSVSQATAVSNIVACVLKANEQMANVLFVVVSSKAGLTSSSWCRVIGRYRGSECQQCGNITTLGTWTTA